MTISLFSLRLIKENNSDKLSNLIVCKIKKLFSCNTFEELELKFSDGRVLTVGQFIDSSNPLLQDIYAFDFFAYKYINFELLDQFKG